MKWENTTLGEISTSIQTGPFGSQLHQSDYSESGTPVVMPKDLVGGKIVTESIARVSSEHVDRLSRHKIIPGDILYSRRGDVGRCAYADATEANWLCGTGCLRVTIDREKANPKFVFYQLQTAKSIGWVDKHAVGATMLNLNTSILSAVPITLPPLAAQNRIANALSAYDDLIENNQKQIKLLEEAAQRLYKEWFVDLRFPGYETTPIVDGVPEGWRKETIGGICSIKKDVVTTDQIPRGMPYIGLEHIPRIDFCLSSWGNAEDVTSNKFKYDADDIIFGKIRPYFHKVGFAINNGVVSTDSFVMRAKNGLWGILLMTVFDKAFVDYTYQTCKEGAKMPRADWRQMEKFEVLIPDDAVRQAFEDYIWSITRRIKTLAFQNSRLSESRDRLLHKLMSGEIEV